MLQEERFEYILSRVSENGAVKVTSVAEELGISQSTIRRDIKELAQTGRLHKVFGGAVANENVITTSDSAISVREKEHIQAKDDIGRFAAEQINRDDFVFIDAGTTTRRIIPYIDESLKGTVTFVTNGVVHARELAARGFLVYLPGGLLKGTTEAIVGTSAVDYVEDCNFTKSFMGTNGVDLKKGYTIPEMDESRMKASIIKNSHTVYVLADSSKFDKVSSVSFGKLEDACIITDAIPENGYSDATVILEAVCQDR